MEPLEIVIILIITIIEHTDQKHANLRTKNAPGNVNRTLSLFLLRVESCLCQVCVQELSRVGRTNHLASIALSEVKLLHQN